MNPLVLFAGSCGVLVGMMLTIAGIAGEHGRHRTKWQARAIAAFLAALILAAASAPAQAATVAEIVGVAKFTDERGECPRLYRVAIAPNGTRGCWTIGEINRRIEIRWPDGTITEFSEIQFNIYAR